jgi:hypothetical protein
MYKQNIINTYCLGLVMGLVFVTMSPRQAQAVSCDAGPFECYMMPTDADSWWQSLSFTTLQQQYLTQTFYQNQIINDLYQNHFVDELWNNNLKPALENMTAQLVAAGTFQAGMIGAMIDGKHTLDVQLRMQSLQAQAVKDYMPGENLCRFGTQARSIGSAEEHAHDNTMALTELAEARQLGRRGSGTHEGPDMDRAARILQYKRLYCDPGDNNGQMQTVCSLGTTTPYGNPTRFNKDIDFTRTVDSKLTLDFDLTGYNNGTPANSRSGNLSQDEEDVLALQNNLFANDIFAHVSSTLFKQDGPDEANDAVYLDVRQLVALRSVALNSFNTITAMRARGAPGATAYMQNVLRNVGMSDPESARYLSANSGEPSYYAQMEILTKKLYQDPNFYVNLIDKPANVKRQLASMKAIELMQNRDIYETMQRQEMLMSILLELDVRDRQADVQRDLDNLNK